MKKHFENVERYFFVEVNVDVAVNYAAIVVVVVVAANVVVVKVIVVVVVVVFVESWGLL